MGVKVTKDLTREQAEERFVKLYLERKEPKARRKAAGLSDKELEGVLEEWNDERSDGEGFENYSITPAPSPGY